MFCTHINDKGRSAKLNIAELAMLSCGYVLVLDKFSVWKVALVLARCCCILLYLTYDVLLVES